MKCTHFSLEHCWSGVLGKRRGRTVNSNAAAISFPIDGWLMTEIDEERYRSLGAIEVVLIRQGDVNHFSDKSEGG